MDPAILAAIGQLQPAEVPAVVDGLRALVEQQKRDLLPDLLLSDRGRAIAAGVRNVEAILAQLQEPDK